MNKIIPNKNLINVTKKAWSKMHHIILETNNPFKSFVYYAESGGCNGFNFKLELLDYDYESKNTHKFSTILNDNDIKLYIEPLSEMYLIGTTIDHVNENYTKCVYESKFLFIPNKDLMNSCGCGISFSPKN